MNHNSNVVPLRHPDEIDDPLTNILRSGARQLLAQAVEAKSHELKIAPEIAVGDGALGFWKALYEVFPATRHQRCWVNKTANILNKGAVSVQAKMKRRRTCARSSWRQTELRPNWRSTSSLRIPINSPGYSDPISPGIPR